MGQGQDKPGQGTDDLLDWFTVSYRSIYIAMAVVLALVAGLGYWWWKGHRPPPPRATDYAPSTSGAVAASLASLDGTVQVKPLGEIDWRAARRDMALRQGDLVRTGAGAGAELRFTNGTTFHMRADSLITIEAAADDPASKKKLVTANLQSGAVNFETGTGSTTISTPVSRTTAGQNAEGDVAVGQDGDTVKIFRGAEEATVETSGGQTFRLKANEAVTVGQDGQSAGKVSLPGTPSLLAPPHQAEITYPDPASAITLLAWKGVAGSATYRIMVDYNQSFTRPLVDQKAWRESRLELRALEVGKFYWKVAAVDATGLEGNFSDVAQFSVARPGPGQAQDQAPPALTVETLAPRGNVVHVKGRTAPGASLTVNGQRVDVQTDGGFNEFVTLERRGRQEVVFRATSVGGGVNEIKRTVVVTD